MSKLNKILEEFDKEFPCLINSETAYGTKSQLYKKLKSFISENYIPKDMVRGEIDKAIVSLKIILMDLDIMRDKLNDKDE